MAGMDSHHHYVEVQEDMETSSPEEAIICNSLITRMYIREAVAEMIGTFLIVFAGGASSILSGFGTISTSICGAMAVSLMIFATGHISRAHLNPAVTLGFAMAGVCSWKQVVPYIIGQILGSLFASVSLLVIVHDATLFSAAINQPSQDGGASFVFEFVATFFLMFMNMKVACNIGKVGVLGGAFMVGITVALLGIYAGPLCGGLSMNPARSIGPAVVGLKFESLYIFILGPVGGAILSGVTYASKSPNDQDKVRTHDGGFKDLRAHMANSFMGK
ncbi:hypothetical protein GOP47_0027206 [Adiantum capillus-veneris]|nr:hypothetical protein GOP47_0027206 [Adiantum capillus-veneris]